MSKLAFIFPGQGSQYLGMGKDFYDYYTIAKHTYEEANEILKFKLSDICFNGPENELQLTENTQPAILTTSIGILRVLKERGIYCDYTAGLSLGEYSALINAESIVFSEAVELVKNRGKYMQEAVPKGIGRMGAIVGLSEKQIESIVYESRVYGLIEIANYNTDEQIVLSGEKKAINIAIKMAKELGAKKALPLPVSAPFHCSLLKSAGDLLSEDLENVNFRNPIIPFISNVSAKVVDDKEKIQQYLVKQVSQTVLWRQSIELLINKGVRTFVEIGPGTTLSNFVKAIASYQGVEVMSESIHDIERFNQVMRVLDKQ